MSLTFRWRSATMLPVDGSILKPETFEAMSPADAARVAIGLGNRTTEVGELFEVDGTTGDDSLILEGELHRVHGVGQGMGRGLLRVEGPVGAMLGVRMSGGTIDVHGLTGDWLGAEMTGGLIRVRGSAGSFVGAAYPGSRAGMRDGAILIEGSAGEDVGLAMRRGLIVVLGDAGDGVGRDMIAGTIMLGGRVGTYLGAGMKRGSLILLNPGFGAESDSSILPTFVRAGAFPANYLTLYKRQLESWGFPLPVPESIWSAPFERYNGDTLHGGLGEILIGSRARR